MGCGGQSFAAQYGGASYLGPSSVFSTVDAATPVLIPLVPIPTDGTPFIPAVFVVSFFSAASSYNLRQGGASVAATSSDFLIDSTVAIGTYWRVDVNDPSQAFLSILTPGGAVASGIVVTRIDSINAAGSP